MLVRASTSIAGTCNHLSSSPSAPKPRESKNQGPRCLLTYAYLPSPHSLNYLDQVHFKLTFILVLNQTLTIEFEDYGFAEHYHHIDNLYLSHSLRSCSIPFFPASMIPF